MKTIQIGNHKVLLDDEDFEIINQVKWYIIKGKKTYYAYRDTRLRNNNKEETGDQIAMHRVILGLDKLRKANNPVDHINGNGLDNRKENLRIVTTQLNTFNTAPKHKNKSSIYKGVMRAKKSWNVQIKLNYKSNNLGTYKDEIYAAKVYDAVVRFYTNDIGYTNFEEVFIEPMSIEQARSYKHKILIN